MDKKTIAKYYYDELFAYMLYDKLSKSKKIKDKETKEFLLRMSRMEKKHAEFWKKIAKERGIRLKEKKFKFRIWFYSLISKISILWMSKIIEIMESQAIKEYYSLYKSNKMNEKEKKEFLKIIKEELLHEKFSSKKNNNVFEHVRDVFLGMNDGLVEILSTVAGMVGIYPSNTFLIGIIGLIVGISGTLSMAIGTWISVKNQKEIKNRKKLEEKIIREIDNKEEIEKIEITENPLKSAYLTGIFYILGTITIVYPFFIFNNPYLSIGVSIVSASLLWIIGGYVIAISSGISIKTKIIQMLLTGWVAALITYYIGIMINKVMGVVL